VDERLDTLAVELLVRDRDAVVIGTDMECESKIERLVAAGARVRVFTEGGAPSARVAAWAASNAVTLIARPFADDDSDGACVVFVSPAHQAIGARLAPRARVSAKLVSTLDRPEHSTFINPAVARGSGLRFAISSGGAAPSLVRALREEIEARIQDPRLARFVEALKRRREAAPRGQRGALGRSLVEGLRVELRFVFPTWFEAEDDTER
jgi:siroheme synthase-like protein